MHKKGEKELADLFDHAAESDDPVPPAPDDEFQTILAEMKRRGIEPVSYTHLGSQRRHREIISGGV